LEGKGAKTSEDVRAVLRKGKTKKPQMVEKVKAQPVQKCTTFAMSNYVVSLDSVLLMVSAILHLVKTDRTQTKTNQ
jgi:hypothetical protein